MCFMCQAPKSATKTEISKKIRFQADGNSLGGSPRPTERDGVVKK